MSALTDLNNTCVTDSNASVASNAPFLSAANVVQFLTAAINQLCAGIASGNASQAAAGSLGVEQALTNIQSLILTAAADKTALVTAQQALNTALTTAVDNSTSTTTTTTTTTTETTTTTL